MDLGVLIIVIAALVALQYTVASDDSRYRSVLGTRVASNGSMVLLAMLGAALVLPDSSVSIAADQTTGLLRSVKLPSLAEIITAFLLMDLWRYWEHRVFHEIPWLWRIHRVHHSDEHLDASTSQRHHPFESMIGAALGALLLFALGFSAVSITIYYAVAGAVAILNHTRFPWPAWLDHGLAPWIATPAAHYVHHSAEVVQTDSNYGAVLMVWDRLFGTWSNPATTVVERVGLDPYRGEDEQSVLALLTQPFRRGTLDPRESTGSSDEALPSRALNPECDAAAAPKIGAHSAHGARVGASPWRGAGWVGSGLLLLALTWSSVDHMVGLWLTSTSYHYALLVLPLFVYLLLGPWRDAVSRIEPNYSLAGVVLLLLTLLAWAGAASIDLKAGEHLTVVLGVQALVLTAIGLRGYASIAPLMCLLLFLVPSGDLLTTPLSILTLLGLEGSLPLIADTVTIEGGEFVTIDGFSYLFADVCAGLDVTLLGAFLGYGFGLMLSQRFLDAAGLGLLGAALAYVSNLVRILLIVAIDLSTGTQMTMDEHSTYQHLTVGGFLLVFLGVVALLAGRIGSTPGATHARSGHDDVSASDAAYRASY